MDVLSSALAVTRTGRPQAFRLERRSPWGRRFAPVAGSAFHAVLDGSCWLISPEGEPLALDAGDVVLLPRGNGHALADSPARSLLALDESPELDREPAPTTVVVSGFYQLDQARPHPLLSKLPQIVHLPARWEEHPQLRRAVDLLGGELANPGHGSEAVMPALMDVLLLYTLRAWYGQEPCTEAKVGWAAALRDPGLSAALASIHRMPERAWTVDAMAAESGLSRTAFARRFAALIEQPPLSYLTWWRMTTAARLLRDSDLPLGPVARNVGYTSEFAFANAFKREYGIAPGKYRQEWRDAKRSWSGTASVDKIKR